MEGIWRCPAHILSDEWMKHDLRLNFFSPNYAYFAAVPETKTNFHSKVIEYDLDSERVLLMDSVYQWWVTKNYTFNHGPGGGVGSLHKPGYSSPSMPVPLFIGTNVGYGDGSARWIHSSGWDMAGINQSLYKSSSSGYVEGGGSKDLSFFPIE